jgi:hypothetical protein
LARRLAKTYSRNVSEKVKGVQGSADEMNDGARVKIGFRKLREYAAWRGPGPLLDGMEKWREERARPSN